ncbi:hypothetical protein TYRP_019941 [Tyrophagus putrescentiae]|nr:hypothetical protein TYRP_019941 [Tyrophagus putrescentiae]
MIMYSNILHNPAKKLVNCSVNLCLTVWKIKLVVRDRLKLLFYIEKFLIKSQKQKYGISYGPLVQLATFTSFAKDYVNWRHTYSCPRTICVKLLMFAH